MALKTLLWLHFPSESLFSRKILAILPPKLVRITRLKVGPDSSCVRHALTHSGLRAVASTMTLRRDAFPASARQRTPIVGSSTRIAFAMLSCLIV
jgi:hypothetical protein